MSCVISTTQFNDPGALQVQLYLLKRFCTDASYDISVVDNSTDPELAWETEATTLSNGASYTHRLSKSNNPSEGYAETLLYGYNHIRHRYDKAMLIEADVFPFKHFSVEELLGDKTLCGYPQPRPNGLTYLLPALLLINTNKAQELDFSTSRGMDTGGGLSKRLRLLSPEDYLFISQQVYNFDPGPAYAEMVGCFMHFCNGSNWRKSPNHANRIQELLRILSLRIEGEQLDSQEVAFPPVDLAEIDKTI